MRVFHLNCGLLHAPPHPRAACHCLLLERKGRLALIDAGIGLRDIAQPRERIGQIAIDAAGFQFHEELTAIRQIERLGFPSSAVADIVLTHGDPDHAGGLSDFPDATVHVSQEELTQINSLQDRYSPAQFNHGPRWFAHQSLPSHWFGVECRPLPLALGVGCALIPLFGHTHGHCGVAIRTGDRWLLHVGDAYYLRAELAIADHPVSALAQLRADDDVQRRSSLEILRRLARDHQDQIELCGYHDFTEFPDTT
ncbi:MAG: MBL fold metallo-hydrolase [Pirellulales bacterium]|nr:MBL fold metallo-hydrolase [Pirellulales bacterium]